jgi:hypothetical protein
MTAATRETGFDRMILTPYVPAGSATFLAINQDSNVTSVPRSTRECFWKASSSRYGKSAR